MYMTMENTDTNPAAATTPDAPASTTPANDEAATRIQQLEEEVARLKDQHLRALAEAENIRRRTLKERDDAVKYGVSSFARDLLDVADNLRRAIEAVPRDHREDSILMKNLITGVEATERQLEAALTQCGVTKIDALGQMFDPNLHRAMQEVDAPNSPPGSILQVFQTGYRIHDRLLREAMVVIARGTSQSAASAPPHMVDQSA
jgi:molecular chaperone GrpE